jgi:hypothetical protein
MFTLGSPSWRKLNIPSSFHLHSFFVQHFMVPEIPCELHELICSHLDLPALKAYSLACYQFHCFAQKFIFANVTLRYPPRTGSNADSRTKDLLDLSTVSPSIFEAIQTVSLVDSGVAHVKSATRNLWDDPMLCSLLPHLRNVKNFGMESLSFAGFPWIAIPVTIQRALIGILHSDVLTCLALYHVFELPLDVLDGCPVLEELSLEFVFFQDKELDLVFFSGPWKPTARRERRTELKSLRVALHDYMFLFFSTWITSFGCNLDISKLQRFSVSGTVSGTTEYGSINRILQATSGTIEIFCVYPTFIDLAHLDAKTATDPRIDISTLSSMRILRLRLGKVTAPLSDDTLSSLHYGPWMFHLFSQLPPMSSVAEISIYVEQAPADVRMWRLLDTVLTPYVANSLRRFTFIAPKDELYTADEIKLAFPNLNSRNILNVQISECEQ